MADRRSHPANLPVAPFPQGNLKPRIRNRLAIPDRRIPLPQSGRRLYLPDSRWPRLATLDEDSLPKLRERSVPGLSFDLRQVALRDLEPGLTDSRLQTSIVGENKKALTVVVETTGRVDTGDVYEVLERGPAISGGELAKHLVWLVEQQNFHTRNTYPAQSQLIDF